MPEREQDKMAVLDKVFSKIDLFWGLGFYGELYEEGNEYCISFLKQNFKNDVKTLPSSYAKSFDNIKENGCWVEYYQQEKGHLCACVCVARLYGTPVTVSPYIQIIPPRI